MEILVAFFFLMLFAGKEEIDAKKDKGKPKAKVKEEKEEFIFPFFDN